MVELSDPSRYQQMLLAAVGSDDPADVLAGAPAEWSALVASAGDGLRSRPAPGEWSAIELLGHVTDAQLVTAARLRWILSEDEPSLLGYDQERWVAAERHADADPDVLLRLHSALIAADVALWRSADAGVRARIGRHAERGPESFELLFRMIAGHHRIHLEQARRALDAARAGR